ncbi:MAG TPA: hypothetical protein DCG63_03835 [Methylophilaceae bacterium]|nr:hypothetical protein [Methylophilaceae bacterium]
MSINATPCNNLPPALFDLIWHIDSAKAVANELIEQIPFGNKCIIYNQAQHASDLAGAVLGLLELCVQDLDNIQNELNKTNA